MREHIALTALFTLLGIAAFGYIWSALYFVMLGFDYNAAMPWSALQTYLRFGANPDFEEQFFTSLAVTSAGFIALAIFWATSGPKKYFGDARWATKPEIKKAALLDKDGVLLGKIGDRYLCNNEPIHTLLTAPTRAGKGVGVVIPNLLSWTDSALILDIKQENYKITSGLRAKHQKVFMFSPTDENGQSHRWNPLDTIRQDAIHRTADVQRLSTLLVSGGKGVESMWVEEARDLFIGLVFYVLDTPNIPATLGEIYRTLKSEHDLSDVLKHILASQQNSLNPAAIMAFNNFINKAAKEKSGVKSTLSSNLNLWSIPSIDAATSASDFRIEDLRKQQMSVYFGTGLNQLEPLSRLIRLFFELSTDILTRKIPEEDEPYKVLMVIDEFGSLGKMPVIAGSLAFVAGYNIRMINIIQGLAQIDELYGEKARESILQNSAIQIFYASNDETTTNYVARRLGDKTIQTESINYGHNTAFGTKSQSYAKTNFIKPEEFTRFCRKHAVIFKEGMRPVKAEKIIYHTHKDFKARLHPAIPVPSLRLEQNRPHSFNAPRYGETPKNEDELNDDLSSFV